MVGRVVSSLRRGFDWREHCDFSAEVGGGETVVLFLYTNLHCTCENMLFWKAGRLWPRHMGLRQGSGRPARERGGSSMMTLILFFVVSIAKSIALKYFLHAIVTRNSVCLTRR
jgi:hypothetical protein